MKPILSRGGKNLELNALFIQPTRWCGLNCKGCYVKDHNGGEEDVHLSWSEIHTLFKLFYRGPHWANQITIAVDDLHKDSNKARHMELIISAILDTMVVDSMVKEQREKPEVHMTLHTPHTFLQYEKIGTRGWEKLSMVSFSEMPLNFHARKVYDTFKSFGVPINYNTMVPRNWLADKEIEHLTKIGREYADHIYLVMHKTPVGEADHAFKIPIQRNHWETYQLYISEVVDRLPVDVRRKVSTDGCVSDTIKYSRTGFGCSSNVSRFQVWPDGSVSGCPYAFSGNTEGAITSQGVVENIRKARQQYDFGSRCHLPSVYTSLGTGSKLRVLQVE